MKSRLPPEAPSARPTIASLLAESGERWMSVAEQQQVDNLGVTQIERPVWMFLSMIANSRHKHYTNGFTVTQHMESLRHALKGMR